MDQQPFDFNALVQFKLLREGAVLPTRGTASSGAFDIYAPEDGCLLPGEKKVIPSGLAHQIHKGFHIPMRVSTPGYNGSMPWKEVLVPFQLQGYLISRSGLAAKHNVKLYFDPCLIDHDYRGEIMLVMINTSHAFLPEIGMSAHMANLYASMNEGAAVRWKQGDRLCQIAYMPTYMGPCQQVDELDNTERGAGGLGSTGMVSGNRQGS